MALVPSRAAVQAAQLGVLARPRALTSRSPQVLPQQHAVVVLPCRAAASQHASLSLGNLALQDAQRKELDLRAPVSKQRAKKFNLEEELKVGAALRCMLWSVRHSRVEEEWDVGWGRCVGKGAGLASFAAAAGLASFCPRLLLGLHAPARLVAWPPVCAAAEGRGGP